MESMCIEILRHTQFPCLMHLQGYINTKGYKLKTLHIADVLASGW
jgi:L-lactate dehydrogenase complex protein LldE